MKHTVAEYETLVGDIHDLRAFALVTDLKSLTAVAKRTGESKATVSRRISRLEAALGTELLRRTPRAVEPTEDGAAYRSRVGEVLELLGDANAAVLGSRAAPSGSLRVTTPPGLEAVLAPMFAAFAQEFPEVVLSALVASRFVDLDVEHIDVALRATAKLPDSSLVALRLSELDRICTAAPSYLKLHPAPRRAQDLASHRVVHLGEPRTSASLALRSIDTKGELVDVVLKTAIAASDVGFAKELAVAGAGLCVLPHATVQRELDEGRLVHLLPTYVVPGAALYLLHRGGRFLPPKVRAFREFMLKAFELPVTKGRRGAR